jgi:hypothetical protein
MPRVFGSAFVPPKLMFGIRFVGFADGKNCKRPGSTLVRSLRSRVSWLSECTD